MPSHRHLLSAVPKIFLLLRINRQPGSTVETWGDLGTRVAAKCGLSFYRNQLYKKNLQLPGHCHIGRPPVQWRSSTRPAGLWACRTSSGVSSGLCSSSSPWTSSAHPRNAAAPVAGEGARPIKRTVACVGCVDTQFECCRWSRAQELRTKYKRIR